MSLRCSVCRHAVDEGLNFCSECRTGFVSQLECSACGRLVPRGSASCLSCSRSAGPACSVCGSPQVLTASGVTCSNGHGGASGISPLVDAERVPSPQREQSLSLGRGVVPPSVAGLSAPPQAPSALPGLPPHVSLAAPVQSRYVSRQGGVEAEVRVPPGDAEVMDLMGQVVVILHTFASRMNTLTGHGELTRSIIRASRVLAADVQEELEQRKGPGR